MTVCVCVCACAYIFLFPALIAGSQFVKKQNKKKITKTKNFFFSIIYTFCFLFRWGHFVRFRLQEIRSFQVNAHCTDPMSCLSTLHTQHFNVLFLSVSVLASASFGQCGVNFDLFKNLMNFIQAHKSVRPILIFNPTLTLLFADLLILVSHFPWQLGF